MRLLIAEDDPRLLRSLAHIFETEGYLVDAVARGDDALAFAESGEYDGLVLDIMMPGRDGVSVLQALRERGISTPALFLTAKDGVAERVQGLDAGMIISADKVLTHIWGWESDVSMSVLWVHISNIRKKLAALGAPASIQFVRGAGYILEASKDASTP